MTRYGCDTQPNQREINMSLDQHLINRDEKNRLVPTSFEKTTPTGSGWIYLALAVAAEVCGLALMKLFGETGRSEGLVILYLFVAVSYFLLAKAVKTISVGVAYAVWEGAGIALITLVSALGFQQFLTQRELLGLSMVIVGIWIIHAGETQSA